MSLPPLPPRMMNSHMGSGTSFYAPQSAAAPQATSFASQATPVMAAMAPLPPAASAFSPLATALNLSAVAPVKPDSPVASPRNDVTIDDSPHNNTSGIEVRIEDISGEKFDEENDDDEEENDENEFDENQQETSNLADKTITGNEVPNEPLTGMLPLPTSTFPNLWGPAGPYNL